MAITQAIVGNTPTTIYQSNGESVVTSLYFCNTTPGTLTFNMYLVAAVPAPGISATADSTNVIYFSVTVAPYDTYVVDTEKILLENNDMIQASASLASAITSTVSYMRY